MDDLSRLTLDNLVGEQLELAECIGLEAYKKLVQTYGGLNVYICKAETILRTDRDSRIKQEFNGVNYKFLASKYNLTERMVRSIVCDELQRLRTEPIPEQITFNL